MAGDAFGERPCHRCPLAASRTRMVVYRGSRSPRVAFVGEAPGREEDEQGRPFVGRSGKLLDRWIQAMGLSNEDVLVTNTVRCRPPENRTPTKAEVGACREHLSALLSQTKPAAVVALGRSAHAALDAMGVAHEYIYHPSYYVRGYRKWPEDVEMLRKALEATLRQGKGNG
ncbi:MAG: uracil-DNA glycosylase [Methanobacteriota archaeon]